ncbi:MAG TPA: redoxin domain-containing protein [Puia sp.]|jgi:peroxiredoxin|nr:redoxin domain-containing protein [Puia sp.]
MKYYFTLVILVLLTQSNICGQQIPAQTLPQFEFSRMDNRPFVNKDLPETKMLFFVFFDSDCSHCQRAVRNIDQQYASFQKTSIYLISDDSQEKINRFVNTFARHLKVQKHVVLLQDNLHQFIPKFKPYRYPAMLLYAPDKKLLDYEDNEESVFRFVHAIKKQTN